MRYKIKVLFTMFVVLIFCKNSFALSNENEKIIMKFRIKDSIDVVAVCISKDGRYIQFRYGIRSNIKVQFPKKLKDSWAKFEYSYYFRGFGRMNEAIDLNYLKFQIGEKKYEIFEEYYSKNNKKNIGLKITDKKNNKKIIFKGDLKSKEGSIISLRFNNKIKKRMIN